MDIYRKKSLWMLVKERSYKLCLTDHGNGTVLVYMLYWYRGTYSHGATNCTKQQSPECWTPGDWHVPVLVCSISWFHLQEKRLQKGRRVQQGLSAFWTALQWIITNLWVFALFLLYAGKVKVPIRNKNKTTNDVRKYKEEQKVNSDTEKYYKYCSCKNRLT